MSNMTNTQIQQHYSATRLGGTMFALTLSLPVWTAIVAVILAVVHV